MPASARVPAVAAQRLRSSAEGFSESSMASASAAISRLHEFRARIRHAAGLIAGSRVSRNALRAREAVAQLLADDLIRRHLPCQPCA